MILSEIADGTDSDGHVIERYCRLSFVPHGTSLIVRDRNPTEEKMMEEKEKT